MPSSTRKRPAPSQVPAEPTYKIFLDGEARRGTAYDLLRGIWSDAAGRVESIGRMGFDRYVSSLIEMAPSQLDPGFMAHLRKEPYASEYDRALRYLTEMPAGGVRILSQTAAKAG